MSAAINADRVLELAGAVCNGMASRDDLAELDSMLLSDEDSCRRYLFYCDLHVALRMEVRSDRAAQKACRETDMKLEVRNAPESDVSEMDAARNTPVMPLTLCDIPPFHSTFGYFSSGWPVAYLVASVIFGIGLVIGAVTQVSHHVQIASHARPVVEKRRGVAPESESVGQITGMGDCQWADESTAAINGARVPLGRRYALASGLMEITYDTGAKVILQGPVTYEVESASGGYLSVGKLTAKLEKNDEARMINDELGTVQSGIHHSAISNQNLFAIRTPTATVTDLGTEFGVEVDREGQGDVHVFVGAVRISPVSEGNATQESMTLVAGDSARTGKGRIAGKAVGRPASFVRQMPHANQQTAYAKVVQADKPLLYWSFDEPTGCAMEQMRHLISQRLYPMGAARRCTHAAMGSGLALGRAADFSGEAGCFRSGMLEGGEMPGAWAIEFWAQFTGDLAVPAIRGILEAGAQSSRYRCNPAILFGGCRDGSENTFVATRSYQPGVIDHCTRGGPQITDHLWHHVILVFYGNGLYFGVADRVDIVVDTVPYVIERRDFTSGCNMEGLLRVGTTRDDLEDAFQGRIDELAFYDVSKMTVRQIQTRVADMARRHFQAAKPATTIRPSPSEPRR